MKESLDFFFENVEILESVLELIPDHYTQNINLNSFSAKEYEQIFACFNMLSLFLYVCSNVFFLALPFYRFILRRVR